jgi:hypothetical protein
VLILKELIVPQRHGSVAAEAEFLIHEKYFPANGFAE